MPEREGIRFGLLGRLVVWGDDGEVSLSAPKPRALLAILLIHRNRPISSDRLIDLLWQGDPPMSARSALQVYVAELRRVLAEDVIETIPTGYRLNAASRQIDVGRFDDLVETGQAAIRDGDLDEAITRLQDALDLARGSPLADFHYANWAQVEIRRLEEKVFETKADLLKARLRTGHLGLVPELEAMVASHPHNERLRGLLAEALYRSGRQSAALRSIEEARRLLREDLGLELSADLQNLEQLILHQQPELEAPTQQRGWLPTSGTSFIGRDRELADLRKLIENEQLVTVVGPAGVGKSRLALELAREFATDGSDVWWVELSSVSDADSLVSHMAQQMGIRELPGVSPLESLFHALGSRHAVLILDTCEHLIGPVADLVAVFLTEIRNTKVVATTRERLRLESEVVYAVEPLPTSGLEPGEPSLSPSERLFLDRVQGSSTGTDAEFDTEMVSRLCNALDGLPLAIEIAAARAKELGVAAMKMDTGTFLGGLSGGDALTSAIQWSYGLLGERARTLFGRLSVFRGSFDFDSARTVCSTVPVEEDEVLDLLNALVDKSLVVVEPTPVGRRYRLLDTLAAFARQVTGAQPETRTRHATHYLAMASDAREPLRGGLHQIEWRRRIETELPNLRAASVWALSTDGAGLLEASSALNPFWSMAARYSDGTRLTELALAADDGGDHPCLRVEAIAGLSGINDAMGDRERAEILAGEALDLARSECESAEHLALYAMAHANINTRDPAKAVELAASSAKKARYAGDQWTEGWASMIGGSALYEQGRHHEARPLLAAARHIFESIDDTFGLAWAMWCLAECARFDGALEEHEEMLRDALPMFVAFDDPWGIGVCIAELGSVARLQGDLERAEQLWNRSLEYHRRAGQRGSEIWTYALLAMVALDRADNQSARELLAHGMEKATSDDLWAVLGLVNPLGRLLYREARPTEAATLVFAALRHWSDRGLRWEPDLQAEWDQLVDRLESALGPDDTKAARSLSEALSENDLLARVKVSLS